MLRQKIGVFIRQRTPLGFQYLLVDEILARGVYYARGRIILQHLVGYTVKEMGLAETGGAVDKERVGFAGVLR